MKKSLFLLLAGYLLIPHTFAVPIPWPQQEIILTNEHESIITPPDQNAMREGSYTTIHGDQWGKIQNLIETQNKIEDQKDATTRTIKLIQRIINYALGFVSVIALVILIFAGFQMITAGGDDSKYQSGKKSLKKITIAIIGIGLSWLFVSFVFWVLAIIS